MVSKVWLNAKMPRMGMAKNSAIGVLEDLTVCSPTQVDSEVDRTGFSLICFHVNVYEKQGKPVGWEQSLEKAHVTPSQMVHSHQLLD